MSLPVACPVASSVSAAMSRVHQQKRANLPLTITVKVECTNDRRYLTAAAVRELEVRLTERDRASCVASPICASSAAPSSPDCTSLTVATRPARAARLAGRCCAWCSSARWPAAAPGRRRALRLGWLRLPPGDCRATAGARTWLAARAA